MNESMNFGDLGFSSVTAEQVDTTPAFSTKEQEEKIEQEDTKVDLEEIKKKDAEAASDFEKTSKGKMSNYEEDAANFSSIDFGPMQRYLDDDDITDISYSNGGQLWLKSLSKGVYRADQQDVDNALMEKIAFQCSNIMGKTFNMAHPFLDSESAELRMNFVHDSIARNGIAVVFRKTPAKIRLEKQKLLNEKYVQLNIHDFLINCVKAHCNIIVCGETGSGKTELVKYLASHTAENEKLISIEDTLELHLDRIYPHRDIVAMKTNNIASYSDVLVTCMRQNPIWILLSEVRSAEAVTAVRNSISSGHYILSTIHADKAESIPHRMYSLLESNIDVEQFLKTIYRYVQIGVFVRGRYKPEEKRFVREIAGVCEFHVTDDEKAEFTNIYLKNVQGEETFTQPSKYLLRFLEGQGCDLRNLFGENKANVTDGMDMSKIKTPSLTIDDDGYVKDKSEESKPAETPKTEEKKEETSKAPKAEESAPTLTVETPKVEAAPAAPTVEAPKVEEAAPTLTVETPKVEAAPAAPKVEAPKVAESAPTLTVETPKVEAAPAAPTVEAPKVEEAAPTLTVETPKVEAAPAAPTVEAPKVAEAAPTLTVEAPKVEETPTAPTVEAPKVAEAAPTLTVEAPKVEETPAAPTVEVPKVENTPLAPPGVEVTVQEAIPEQPVNIEITGTDPNDIVAKPLIDINTLVAQNTPQTITVETPSVQTPSVEQNTQPVVQGPQVVEQQPVAAPQVQPGAVVSPQVQTQVQQPQQQVAMVQQPSNVVAAQSLQPPGTVPMQAAPMGNPMGFMADNTMMAPPMQPQVGMMQNQFIM